VVVPTPIRVDDAGVLLGDLPPQLPCRPIEARDGRRSGRGRPRRPRGRL
jgi:hypothetical protein